MNLVRGGYLGNVIGVICKLESGWHVRIILPRLLLREGTMGLLNLMHFGWVRLRAVQAHR